MKVIFTKEVALRVDALVKATDTEVAWFGLGDPVWNESGERVLALRIDEIYVPTQEVSATTVNSYAFKGYKGKGSPVKSLVEDFSNIDKFEAFDYWQKKYGDDFLARLCHFGHSHVNMGTSPSPVDKDFWEEWIAGVPNGHAQWLAATIHNQKGEVYSEIRVNAPGVGDLVMDAEFQIEATENEYTVWAKNEIKEKCKKAKTEVHSNTYKPQRFDGAQTKHFNDRMLASIQKAKAAIMRETKLTENQFQDAVNKLRARCEQDKVWITDLATQLENTRAMSRSCEEDRFLQILLAWMDEVGPITEPVSRSFIDEWDEEIGLCGGWYA